MSEIVYKNKNLVIGLKPAGISSQPDKTMGKSFLEECSDLLKREGDSGELFPVHRLDKVVGGLLVVARTASCAAAISEGIKEDDFSKDYIAVVEGVPDEGEYIDFLIKNNILSKAEIVSSDKQGAKEASLSLTVLETVAASKGNKSLVKVSLKTGRFHQIRAQLSGRGCPIVGDKKYGSKDFKSRFPALFAYKLSVEYDATVISRSSLPDVDAYPWNLFSKNIYEEIVK